VNTPLFRAAEIRIFVRDQTQGMKVSAFVVEGGYFAIHLFLTRAGAEEAFVVTHVPSGLKMPGGPWTDVTLAAKFCELVSEIEGVDWSLPSVKFTPEQSSLVSQIIGRTTQ
jgi:hypothetical protein